jgi:poly(3-hydroxybutyrate) depolymerase
VGFVCEVLEKLKQKGVITNTVFALGRGFGGLMVKRLVLEKPEVVTAAAVWNCALPQVSECRVRGPKVPLLLLNSDKDRRFLWYGGSIGEKGGLSRSVLQTQQFWISHNRVRVDSRQETTLYQDKQTGIQVTRILYEAGWSGAPLCLLEIKGAGGTVPSIRHEPTKKVQKRLGPHCHVFDAAELGWQFLGQAVLQGQI